MAPYLYFEVILTANCSELEFEIDQMTVNNYCSNLQFGLSGIPTLSIIKPANISIKHSVCCV